MPQKQLYTVAASVELPLYNKLTDFISRSKIFKSNAALIKYLLEEYLETQEPVKAEAASIAPIEQISEETIEWDQ